MKVTKAGILGALALLGTSGAAWAKEKAITRSEVPQAVQRSFAEKYPQAKDATFALEKEKGGSVYEVSFGPKDAATEVSLRPDGTVVGEERTMAVNDLPASVRSGLAGSKFAKAKVLRAEQVTEGGAHSFELLVEQKGEQRELTFDGAGHLTKNHEADEADEQSGAPDAD